MHCMKAWIYNILTTVQMWRKCVCICNISAIVNENFIFTAVLTIFTNTFAPHLSSSKYIVNPNVHAVICIRQGGTTDFFPQGVSGPVKTIPCPIIILVYKC